MESASGLSTYCRSCGRYYKIQQQLERIRAAEASEGGFFSFFKKKRPSPPTNSHPDAHRPILPIEIKGVDTDTGQVAMATAVPHRPPHEKLESREVLCFDCRNVHRVVRASTSSLCPNCGCYIDLRDVTMKDRTAQRIRTRGDVVVEKKGALLGTSITCGNLTVHGMVSGSIYASGEVVFKTSGRVLGEIRCKKLTVDKKCDMHFIQPVHAENAEIYGDTHGSFYIAHKTVLGKKGSIHGSLETKLMQMEPGADVHGNLVINPHPEVDIFGPSSKELDAMEANLQGQEPGIGALFLQTPGEHEPLPSSTETKEESKLEQESDATTTTEEAPVAPESSTIPPSPATQPAAVSLEDQIRSLLDKE